MYSTVIQERLTHVQSNTGRSRRSGGPDSSTCQSHLPFLSGSSRPERGTSSFRTSVLQPDSWCTPKPASPAGSDPDGTAAQSLQRNKCLDEVQRVEQWETNLHVCVVFVLYASKQKLSKQAVEGEMDQ